MPYHVLISWQKKKSLTFSLLPRQEQTQELAARSAVLLEQLGVIEEDLAALDELGSDEESEYDSDNYDATCDLVEEHELRDAQKEAEEEEE